MVSAKSFVFIAACAAAAVLPRSDTPVELTDLQEIDKHVNKLYHEISVGPINSIAIAIDVDQTLAAINKAAGDAASPIPDPAATDIVNYLSQTLQPDTIKTISIIDSRRSAFESVLLGPSIVSDLKKLQGRAAVLGGALNTSIPAQAATINTLFGSVDAALARAIVDFQL